VSKEKVLRETFNMPKEIVLRQIFNMPKENVLMIETGL
jgi:hypothetical protein